MIGKSAQAQSADALAAYNAPMRILIANDDGYLAPGLAALVQACAGLGEIDVVAPEQNASGTSNSLTLNRPLSVFEAARRGSARASRSSTARRRTACTWR